jgi:peptidoglycan/LPS O-acetylase OafA/YrhL
LPAFTAEALGSHLLLVQAVRKSWASLIDPPMWSVSTEWLIYFLFPLFVWTARRLGGLTTVIVGFAIGHAFNLFLKRGIGGDFQLLYPSYVCIFTMGMAGAMIGFSRNPRTIRWRDRIPWGLGTMIGVGGIAAIDLLFFGRFGGPKDLLAGAASVCLIIACARDSGTQGGSRRSIPLRILESRWLVGLGHFSYSLYLTHFWVLATINDTALYRNWDPSFRLLLLLLIATPLSVLVAYLFYLAVERRFIPGRTRPPGEAPR